ncbi:MAG TPA: PspC domain-containing protein [Cellulomonas sp.]
MTGIYESMWRNGLVRPLDGRMIGGVCAGLARKFGMEATPMRWLFVLLVVVLPGSPILFYPLLWIFMPGEEWVARTHGSAYPGQQPPAQPAYGQPPYGQAPYGQTPHGPQPGQGGTEPPTGQSPTA